MNQSPELRRSVVSERLKQFAGGVALGALVVAEVPVIKGAFTKVTVGTKKVAKKINEALDPSSSLS